MQRLIPRFVSGRTCAFLAVVIGLWMPAIALAEAQVDRTPALVLWITVDQLRADMPVRYVPCDAAGGFRYLREHGVYYTNAQFQHANTFTAVGHAALFTGAHVAQHGIAGNDWYDATTRKDVDSVQDDQCPLLGVAASPKEGASPRNLTSSTVGDELVMASGGRSRVFSVSGKDRGAILPGGRLGKAFWLSPKAGVFVTSTYYGKTCPAWVERFNAARPAERYRDQVWALKDAPATYVHRDRDDRPCEHGYKHLGRTFPHAMATENTADFLAALMYTPFADELIEQFVEELMAQEKPGQGPATDMLAISFSATDQIGHMWGPESLEAEDNVRRIDALLAKLLKHVDRTVGLDRTLLVVSADHGMDDIPECASAAGFAAGRHYPEKFMRTINEALKTRFKTDQDLLKAFWNPSLYLNLEVVARLGLDVTAVERAVAEEVLRIPGFAFAVTRTDLLTGRVPDDPIGQSLQFSFHPTRSGNVMVVPAQFWYLYPEPEKYAATHGTPYAYDTTVPIFFAGPGIRPQTVHRAVAPESIAPTLAACLRIKPPSGCTSRPLDEVPAFRAQPVK